MHKFLAQGSPGDLRDSVPVAVKSDQGSLCTPVPGRVFTYPILYIYSCCKQATSIPHFDDQSLDVGV